MNAGIKKILIGALLLMIAASFLVAMTRSNNLGSRQEIVGGITNNVSLRDGVQYITIDVESGYQPRHTLAQSGVPTKLIMRSNGSYGCELALVIPSIRYSEMLPPSGDTEIDVGVGEAGENLSGMCSMGMYGFEVEFV
jgi:plastocyanin domain-containing protein